MDLLRLDATFTPDEYIEGWRSLIWTERYVDPGEFELRSPLISNTRTLLPEGSFVTLRDSAEVMIVETHSIAVTDNGEYELMTKGRSLESFLENRVILTSTDTSEKWPMIRDYTTAGACLVLLWNFVVNTSGTEVIRANFWATDFIDRNLPNVVISDSVTAPGSLRRWWLQMGDLYPFLIRFLNHSRLGIRNIRPSGTSALIVTTVNSSTGTVTKATDSDVTELRMDVYNGLDRSKNQSTNTPVIFHYASGHINDPSYLFSIRDYRTVVYVGSDNGYYAALSPDNGSGFDHREKFVDGGTQGSLSLEDFEEAMTQRAENELSRSGLTTIFDGEISPFAPYKYKVDYDLGDKVTIMGEYGVDETVRVTEYIRTQDESGERGYPTLSDPS